MIKGIKSNGKYLYIHGGHDTYPNISAGAAGSGMVRWNPNMQQLEVNDGNTWLSLENSYPTVELSNEAIEILDWARKKREQEQQWYKLASNNEAVRIALEQLEQAQTRVELTAYLARDYDTETTS
jgi:hypothetical protein